MRWRHSDIGPNRAAGVSKLGAGRILRPDYPIHRNNIEWITCIPSPEFVHKRLELDADTHLSAIWFNLKAISIFNRSKCRKGYSSHAPDGMDLGSW